MKIKTLESLEDAMNKHLAWRKKEMMTLKLLIKDGDEARVTLIRAGMALLCAHFEGFIRDASNDYLSFISNQNIIYKELQSIFSVMKMHSLISEWAKSPKYSVQDRIFKEYDKLSTKIFCIENQSVIDTHSNPSTKVLQEILLTLGLNTNIFDIKGKYIDGSLLSNRHKIVHGERIELEYDDFLTTFDIIMQLLEEYKNVLVNAATEEIYKKQEK